MMPLSRAPRQVYRVFDEQEFLAEDWVDALQTACPEGAERPGSERRHRRLVGAAMLCSAVSAVGGLVVVNCLSSVTGSRRSLDRSLRTVAEAIGPARVLPTHVWRASMLADGLGRRSQHGDRVEAGGRARLGDTRAVAFEVDTHARGSVRRVAANPQPTYVATTGVTSDVPSAGAVALNDSSGDQRFVGESSPDGPRASASAAAASPARAEFGFER
jgi:hypothetical protein